MGDEDSSTKKPSRAKYHKELYQNNVLLSIRASIRYYRKKKDNGQEWKPKPSSRLYLWCDKHGLDVEAVIDNADLIKQVNVA